MLIKEFILRILNIYSILIIIRVIVSWISLSRDNVLIQVLYNLTEPTLGAIRKQMLRYFPNMMIDFSPMIVLILINILSSIVSGL